MGIFEHFPYVNFHELNLSWIVNKLKEIEEIINTNIVDPVARAGVATNTQAINNLSTTVTNNATTAHNEASAAQSTADAAALAAGNAQSTATSASNTANAASSAVSTLTTQVNKQRLHDADHTYSNLTLNAQGYVSLGNIESDFSIPVGSYIVSFFIRGWTGASHAISLAASSNGTTLYLMGTPNDTVSSVSVRVWYCAIN